ncbi:protein EI24 homolog isoform X2 [Impatiens glandulifera]|nr:protein EI24 homolog isoform X2 [Impatiens glandulifera]
MEGWSPLMEGWKAKLKQASFLWLDGFREACCLHRVVIYCLRSRQLMIRTGQCFLLNGFIFLGSIFILNSVVIPALFWLLPDLCPRISLQEPCSYEGVLIFYSFLRLGLVQLFYIFWFYPLYIFSFILSTLWYNDIAKFGFLAIESPENDDKDSRNDEHSLTSHQESQYSHNANNADKPINIGGIMIGIAEQTYSLILLSFFFLQVYITGFIPYVGKPLNFLLLSWMYAYYCFEYKWNFSGISLDIRLDFFESNWAFFAGFGSTCVIPLIFFSPLVSYGVMAILFPLFVLTATGSDADKLMTTSRRKWRGAGLKRLPIFATADYMS